MQINRNFHKLTNSLFLLFDQDLEYKVLAPFDGFLYSNIFIFFISEDKIEEVLAYKNNEIISFYKKGEEIKIPNVDEGT